MKIQPIIPYKYNTVKAAAFGSSERKYRDSLAENTIMKGEISNFTEPFRWDVSNWFDYADYILYNFKNKDTVNFYCLGCSDGSEAYTMAIALKNSKNLGYKKVFPIYALDKDEGIIQLAKSGRINLSSNDCFMIECLLGTDQRYFIGDGGDINDKNYRNLSLFSKGREELTVSSEYKKNSSNWKTGDFKSFRVSDDLRKSVIFETGDILEKVKRIKDDGNSYIACRNVTPYLPEDYKKELAATLKVRLKTGSLVALGDFDHRGSDGEYADFSKLLLKNGFKRTDIRNLYIRK